MIRQSNNILNGGKIVSEDYLQHDTLFMSKNNLNTMYTSEGI